MSTLEFVEVNEPVRIYHFPGGETIKIENVTGVCVRPSGTHRLKTKDGMNHIVPVGWLHVEFSGELSF